MTVLRGTHINPSLMESPLDQVKVAKEGTKAQRKALQDRLDKWKAFQETENGKTCAEMADPMIAHCNHVLGLSVVETGYPLDVLNDYKAEIRGRRYVWQLIKEDPARLKRLLEGLGEDEEKGKVGWKSKKSTEK